MRETGVPPLSASIEHFRAEVGHRAAGQRLHQRRVVIVRSGTALALALALVVSFLIVRPGTHTEPRANSSVSPTSGSAVPSPSGRSPAADGAGSLLEPGCPPKAVCLDANSLEGPANQPQFNTGALEGRSAGTPPVNPVTLPSDGALEFRLRSSTTEIWGVPIVTRGTGLKHRPTTSSPDRIVTTVFVPVLRSGTAVVSVSCTGSGCRLHSYRVDVRIVSGSTTKPSTSTTPTG